MPVLHLENVPDELFRRIEQLAAADALPVPEATVKLLQRAVNLYPPSRHQVSRSDVKAVLDRMERNRITPAPGTPDSVELLREDRNR